MLLGLSWADIVELDLDVASAAKLPGHLINYLREIGQFLASKPDDHRDVDALLFMADVVIDYAWEMLNTNLWVFVADHLRLLYGYGTLYKALLTHVKTEDADQVVKLCDLGLLMSGHLLERKFNTIVRHVRGRDAKSKQRTGVVKHHGQDDEQSCSPLAKVPRVEQVLLSDEHALAVEESPSVERFRDEYLSKQVPCIIRNQMSHWPALRKWSLDYIVDLAGKRTVPIEIGSKYSDTDWSQKLMTIEEFIDKHIKNAGGGGSCKGYLAQHQLFEQIPELKEDIYIPEYCYYATSADVDDVDASVDINAWFGPAGTVSPLHYDPKPNFLCQVIGSKYTRLVDKAYSDRVYPHDDRVLKNTSQLDFSALDDIDYERFPLAKGVPYWEGILEPGDMLFIPPKCWHYMRSLSLSFSVNFWWE